MPIRLANAPCSWGLYQLSDTVGIAYERILDEIARSGYTGTELGPYGFFPTEPVRLKDALQSRGLSLPAGSAKEPYHVREARPGILERVRRTCMLLRDVGAEFVVILGGGADARLRTAGRSDAAARLDASDWTTFCEAVMMVGKLAKEEFGLTAVLHPHAGSYVEFADEVARALDNLDPAYVGLCIDTGHCAYAGIDPIRLFSDHVARTSYFHFKNVDGTILVQARRNGTDLPSAVKGGVFCPLDRGLVDFAELARTLDRRGFSGWATIEQDCDVAAGGDPFHDARESFAFLRGLGLTSTVPA